MKAYLVVKSDKFCLSYEFLKICLDKNIADQYLKDTEEHLYTVHPIELDTRNANHEIESEGLSSDLCR